MADYFLPTMKLYIEHMVDWKELSTWRRGPSVDVAAELGAYTTLLETAASLVSEFEPVAREKWDEAAELTDDGGAQPPAHVRAAYEKLRETGLVSLLTSEEYGGHGVSFLVNVMVMEMIARADPSLMTLWGLQTGIAQDIERYGSEEIKREYLPRFASGEVQGCMDLTEPQAGSDLGGIQTRATDQPDGTVRVDGQKIYITNGGAEVHLVLARDADLFEQSKGTTGGLSLILVPRHLPDGTRNPVRVTRLERKLGIHASPTCEVVFEDAVGYRIAEKGRGFRAMLDLMNASRIGVAAQAVGLAHAAFHEAHEYALQRKQFGNPILDQPLVKTMLARMLVDIEAARALLYRTVTLLDRNDAREAAISRGHGGGHGADLSADVERDVARARLLTPLAKYFCTEMCIEATRDALQVFGGIGYTMDSNAPKLHADALILTIYEGTSEIQASFALKEMGKGGLAVVIAALRGELAAMDDATRAPLARRLEESLTRLEESAELLFGDIGYALLRAKLAAQMLINAVAGTELLRQVGVAPQRLDLAEVFIRRRTIETEEMARRIEENAEGRLDRDTRLMEGVGTVV